MYYKSVICRVFLSLFLAVGLMAVFSSDSRFSRRAAMQSKNISMPRTESLVPDLGIGASLMRITRQGEHQICDHLNKISHQLEQVFVTI